MPYDESTGSSKVCQQIKEKCEKHSPSARASLLFLPVIKNS